MKLFVASAVALAAVLFANKERNSTSFTPALLR